jgi:hypothetical protein
MSNLQRAALAAVESIERGDSIEYLQNVVVPALLEALRVKGNFTTDQRKILSALKEGPRLFADMSEDLPITKLAAQRAVTQLIDRKMIHIKSFRVGGGPSQRVLAIGASPPGHRAIPAVMSKKRPSGVKIILNVEKKEAKFVPSRDLASSWI